MEEALLQHFLLLKTRLICVFIADGAISMRNVSGQVFVHLLQQTINYTFGFHAYCCGLPHTQTCTSGTDMRIIQRRRDPSLHVSGSLAPQFDMDL